MLQKVIESLADSETSLEEGLRQLLVVAYRTQSDPLKEWLQGELNGYDREDSLPHYRQNFRGRIQLTFVGWGPTYKTVYFISSDIPEELRWWEEKGLAFPQSVTELEALSSGPEDPGIKMPNSWVARYQVLEEEGKATSYTGMTLEEAQIIFPRTIVLALLGNIRNQSLQMALELEAVSPDVGNLSEMTEEQTEAAKQVINVFISTMTGDMNTTQDGIISQSSAGGTVNNSLQYNDNAAESSNIQGDNNTMN
ncbi:hypothetical protein [Corynebacterium efficiens]|uniref:AbiTii domain-containing protein n=1 Tax=Corynebacterium efficiens TaxID=152794 RepID=UPI00117D3044|nr:hypothetical protein [Corynebacterium efficiens]